MECHGVVYLWGFELDWRWVWIDGWMGGFGGGKGYGEDEEDNIPIQPSIFPVAKSSLHLLRKPITQVN